VLPGSSQQVFGDSAGKPIHLASSRGGAARSGSVALFAAPAYLRRRGRPKRLADLGEHECLRYRVSVASAGVGIGLLPLEVVHATVRRGELVPVLPQYRATGAAVCVVLPSSVFVPSRVALLRDHLVAVLSKQLASARAGCAKEARRKPRSAGG
jgi:hypothetical protein